MSAIPEPLESANTTHRPADRKRDYAEESSYAASIRLGYERATTDGQTTPVRAEAMSCAILALMHSSVETAPAKSKRSLHFLPHLNTSYYRH